MKKVYKTIEKDSGKITFYGSNRAANLEYNADYTDQYFYHYGQRYYLSEFMYIDEHMPDYMQEFDGYLNDTFFSGVVVKLDHEEMDIRVKVFTFIS